MSWHEDDSFWRDLEPVLFDRERFGRAAEEVDGALARLDLAPGARVLDLCCGPGRHALELARRGFRVTGVDRTERYLERARRAAAEEGLELEFVHADARALDRRSEFDAAVCLYTSFGYFEEAADDERVLANLAAALVPGGRLLIDVHGVETLARVFEPYEEHKKEDGTILIEDRKILDDWRRIRTRWTIVSGAETRVREFTLRLYSGAGLAEAIERAGFRSVQLRGGWDGRPYDHEAERLLASATRA